MTFPCTVTGLRQYIILGYPRIHSLQNKSLATRFLKWTQCQWIEDRMRNVLNNKIAQLHKLPEVFVPKIFVCILEHFKKMKANFRTMSSIVTFFRVSHPFLLVCAKNTFHNKIFFHSYVGQQITISCSSKFYSSFLIIGNSNNWP